MHAQLGHSCQKHSNLTQERSALVTQGNKGARPIRENRVFIAPSVTSEHSQCYAVCSARFGAAMPCSHPDKLAAGAEPSRGELQQQLQQQGASSVDASAFHRLAEAYHCLTTNREGSAEVHMPEYMRVV